MNQADLSPQEVLRYSRHLLIPDIGMDGQRKLKSASIVIIGAGGLGTPLSMYLAAAGIGRIGLVEFDQVEESNLQRQVLYGDKDVGQPKIDIAEARICQINPHIRIDKHSTRLTSENALNILQPYDVIIDGTDNFPTRYLSNDAAVILGKPNVYGSIYRFDGQVSVFDSRRGPCYRCLYPSPPPPELVPSCAEGGVLGVLPGIIGSLQALEALKIVLSCGESLAGRLVLFDALRFSFEELKIRKNPTCPVCSDQPSITELIDYNEFCGVASYEDTDTTFNISVEDLHRHIQNNDDVMIIDVRRPEEYEICNLGGTLIPLTQLPDHLGSLDDKKKIIVHCHSGGRSLRATMLLRNAGFKNAYNLAGGIAAWAERIDPDMLRY